MQDRRSFVIGGAAVGALVVFEASALAVAAERRATQPPKEKSPAGWRVTHERPDGIVTVYEYVTELGGPAGGPIFISFDDDVQRFPLPPGHFWMERGGHPLLPRRPC